MSEPKQLKIGDACPSCGGAMGRVAAMDADEFRKVTDRENPVARRPGVDSASPEQRAELGDLYRCQNSACRYEARFKAPEAASASDARK